MGELEINSKDKSTTSSFGTKRHLYILRITTIHSSSLLFNAIFQVMIITLNYLSSILNHFPTSTFPIFLNTILSIPSTSQFTKRQINALPPFMGECCRMPGSGFYFILSTGIPFHSILLTPFFSPLTVTHLYLSMVTIPILSISDHLYIFFTLRTDYSQSLPTYPTESKSYLPFYFIYYLLLLFL